jgi:Mg2+ and Co2+ transporter CorA
MTKTQARAKLKPLLERLGDLRADLFDLRDALNETAEGIKPYKDRKSPRYEQELRKDWFENVADAINDLVYEMNHAESELEER